MGISGQKAPQGWILRTRKLLMRAPKGTPKRSRDLRSLQVTFHASLLVKRPPLERILRNFRLRMRTCKGTSERVTSGSPVGHAQWYYCTTTLVRKKAREPVAHAQNILPVTSGQELFRSCDFRWRHFRSSMRNGKILWIFRKCDLNCGHILLVRRQCFLPFQW
jgi:hypothetical protein